MAIDRIDAILPAGGVLTDAEGKKRYKANLPIGDSTLLKIVTRALRESGHVRHIVLVGPEEVTKGQDADIILPPGKTGPDNIYRGLEPLLAQLEPPKSVLIATTDLPFLKPESVATFLSQVNPAKQLNVSIIRGDIFTTTYPGAHATFVKLKEGGFTLGGLFHLDAQALLATRPHIEAIFEARKSKFEMARLFGFSTLLRYLTGGLNLAGLEKTAERILGCTACTLPNSPVELAYDVDSLAEYEYAVEKLKS